MNRCEQCGFPVPVEDESLASQLVAELRQGAASGRTLAGRVHRRRLDVMRVLHELADAGTVTLERPTRSSRSEQWSLQARGARWEPHTAPLGSPRDSGADTMLLGLLAALAAAPRPWPLRLALGVGLGIALVLLGSLVSGGRLSDA